MESKQRERLYALTSDWRMNTVFLEPPERVVGQPQIMDTVLPINTTGDKNQEFSDIVPKSEFTTTTKKLKVKRPGGRKPKNSITLSKTNNISPSYMQSVISPDHINTFPVNTTGDKNQETSDIVPKSEFTTTTKKLKVGRKPKNSNTLSETDNISSSYIKSNVHSGHIKINLATMAGDNSQVNSIAANSDFSETAKKSNVGRPRGSKQKTSYDEVKTKNNSYIPRVERNPPSPTNQYMAFTKYYQMFLNIQNQIIKKHNNLFPVPPKPPSGFKDYIMNKHTYILASDSNSQLVYTPRLPPTNLHDQLKTLFVEQEKERQKLHLQHTVEKEKFILCVEQEIFRVHGKIARELANQPLPFSVCTLLLDKELVNKSVSLKKVEDNNKLVQPENDGSIYISWLQELDDKWEKSKVDMIWRHRNEAGGLYNIQKMDWEWKLMELKLGSYSPHLNIENEHIPIVEVNEDFIIYQTEKAK